MIAATAEPDLWLELKRRIHERRLDNGEDLEFAENEELACLAEEARLSAEIEQLRTT